MKRVLATTILVALSACGSNSSPPSLSTGGGGCRLNYPAFNMFEPASGATGVAVSTPELIFSGTPDKASYIAPSITITTAAGYSYTTTGFTQVTGVDAPGSFYSVKLPPLSPATTYFVGYTFADAPYGQVCGGPSTVPDGQFTTQ